MLKKILGYFTKLEWGLWLGGVAVILVGFFIGAEKNLLSLFSSLFGVTCIIFNAKGNVWGQVVSIGFALLYATLAYFNRYYGEMIIYLALMTPIHLVSIVVWLKNRNTKAEHIEVKINSLSAKEYAVFAVVGAGASVGFYFLLQALDTDNLIVSTISLITSLAAAYLMLRRCEYFAVSFVLNDVILIVLWSLKICTAGISVLPSVLSFVIFLANDAYSYFSWKNIKRRQRNPVEIEEP